MYRLVITPNFEDDIKNFVSSHPELKEKLIKSLKELLSDPDHPSLRTHKLGNNSEWSISIDMATRIIFDIKGDEIILIRLGPHDEVYRP
ncbi:MAG: Plasmid stabilization system [uncultured bacterium]|nr:MAG: Plasmid stabilization system [uncultured bacterium]